MPKLGEADDASDHAAERVIRQVPGWDGLDIRYAKAAAPVASPMRRGVDGDCWRVTVGTDGFFLKIPSVDAHPFVDPRASVEAAEAASAAGVSPRLVWGDPLGGAAVWEDLGAGWRTASLADLAEPRVMAALVEALRRLHQGRRLARDRSVFDLAEAYTALAIERQVPLPEDHGWMLDNVRAIARAMSAAPLPALPCHGEGIASNVMIAQDGGLRLVDWDEAANADPFWDLGALFAEAFPFDPPARAALARYLGRDDEALFARCRLYGIADDFAWGTRSLVSAARTARPDLEHFKYAQWRLLRCRMEMHGRRFEERLRCL